jgi:hypothetical protein
MMKYAAIALALTACVDTRDPLMGTQSLRIELKSSPGTEEAPLDPATSAAIIDVTALGPEGEVDTSFTNDLQVYVNFLGTLTPYLGGPPLATVKMSAGKATNQTIMLPRVYGAATLWLDDGRDENPTYASGASPVIWYRDPYIADIQTPSDEMALDALESSPLENKQVTVNGSRNGAMGKLIVTSVFTQGYTVSDVSCGATGPCTLTTNPSVKPTAAPGYDHKMVFSFSAARDENGCLIKEGQFIDGFAGGVSEFNGLTELGFPQTFVEATKGQGGDRNCDAAVVDPSRIPAPAQLDATWYTNKYMFERNEAGLVAVTNAKVCNLDNDYTTYKQWKIDPAGVGGDCMGNKNVINLISTGVVPTDPATLVGKTLPRVVGVLRPVNIKSFNVWILYPRDAADLTLQ